MGTLVLIALVLGVVVLAATIGVAVVVLRHRAAPGPAQPRTVADLVRLRAEQQLSAASRPVPAPAPPTGPTPSRAVVPAPRIPSTERVMLPKVPEAPDSRPTAQAAAGSAMGVDSSAASGAARASGLRPDSGMDADTPWGRAALMVSGSRHVEVPAPARVAAPASAPASLTSATPAPATPASAIPASATPALATPDATSPDATSPDAAAPDAAAERAAVDRALVRTFGFGRPDDERVELEAPDAVPASAPDGDVPQQVRFRAVGRDGRPVPGVAVALLDDHGREAATSVAGADGHGELRAPRIGAYVLVSTAPGHQPGAAALAVGSAPVEAELLLARSATVHGVVHGEDGAVVGARLTLLQDGEVVDVASTGTDGGYRLTDLAMGGYGLSVTAPDYEPATALLDLTDGADRRHDVELLPAGLPSGDGDGPAPVDLDDLAHDLLMDVR